MTVNPSETRKREHLALSLVETCVRNTGLEDLHAGRWPRSATGDYSDVRVMTPDGAIPWSEVSRISDEEMKILMIEIVNRVHTCLTYPEILARPLGAAARWRRPRFDLPLMKAVRRAQAPKTDPDPHRD